MKILYIDINNESIEPRTDFIIRKYDCLLSDFYFHLGSIIARDCAIKSKTRIITEFNTSEDKEDFKYVVLLWHELKKLLFKKEVNGIYDFTIPQSYLHWLKLHPQYVSVYDKNFLHKDSNTISIDLTELYEDTIVDLQKYIIRQLKSDYLYQEIDRLIINDDAVDCDSFFLQEIIDKYNVSFISYSEYKKSIEYERLEREQRIREQLEREQREMEEERERSMENRIKNEREEKKDSKSKNSIRKGTTEIAWGDFESYRELSQLSIPNSVTSIGECAFAGFTNLKYLEIPHSVTFIGDYAFLGCENLTQFSIPDTVIHIGNYAFHSCKRIDQFDIPECVKFIGKNPFQGCTNLKTINCKSKNFHYDNYALYTENRKELITCISKETLFVIPDFVTHIRDYAFSDCECEEIIIPNSVKHIGKSAFYNCRNLTQLNLPDTVEYIDDDTFWGCRKLNKLILPSSLKFIGRNPFSDCDNLEMIKCNSDSFYYDNYALYTKDRAELIAFISKKNVIGFRIPNSVTNIRDNAFKSCKLRQLDIPNSVRSIGDSAFNCSDLEVIYLPNSVTDIGKNAFGSCYLLERINVAYGTLRKFKNLLTESSPDTDFSNILFEVNNNERLSRERAIEFELSKPIVKKFRIRDVLFNMIQVKAGTCLDEDENEILVTNDIYIGETPVTQELFKTVMGYNPSYFHDDWRKLPVEQVCWEDCKSFIDKLNEISCKKGNYKFRLPTDTEWDFAARGGWLSNSYYYSGSNDIDDIAWHRGNSDLKTHPVAQKMPNELGLYDMCGNVNELCVKGKYGRVVKGGSYRGDYNLRYCNNFYSEDIKSNECGFRIVLENIE